MHRRAWDSLPPEFVSRIRALVPVNPENILKSFSRPKPPTFRANTIKISADELEKQLRESDFEIERVSWYTDAFVLRNRTQRELTDTRLYRNGCFYVQSLSSMIPPLVLDPKPGEFICDITAAPGSKTSQIAMIMGNSGQIIANDKNTIRSFKLKANLITQGITNTSTTKIAAEAFWKQYPERFDRTLADVPCSLEGMILTSYPKSYVNWSRKKIKELSKIQRFILRSAISATKPGGTIVYSTCTLAPEENEGVIQWILEKEGDALEIDQIDLQLPMRQPAITEWNSKRFRPDIQKAIRIAPDEIMEGFFVCKLKKRTSTVRYGIIQD